MKENSKWWRLKVLRIFWKSATFLPQYFYHLRYTDSVLLKAGCFYFQLIKYRWRVSWPGHISAWKQTSVLTTTWLHPYDASTYGISLCTRLWTVLCSSPKVLILHSGFMAHPVYLNIYNKLSICRGLGRNQLDVCKSVVTAIQILSGITE